MLPGVSGRLISAGFAETELSTLGGLAEPPASATREVETWAARRESSFGPASSIRALTDGVAIPLLKILGYTIGGRLDRGESTLLQAMCRGQSGVPALIFAWDEPLDGAWRRSVSDAVGADARWCFCFNGTRLRIVDAHRTWTRHYLEFDLALVTEMETLTLLWRLGSADSVAAHPPVLDRAVDLSARHGTAVCGALGNGVVEGLELLLGALRRRRRTSAPDTLLEQSLTVLYRILFLLFAEARGLVPVWHPIYRDRYTLDSIVAALLAGRRYRGVWLAIDAISRIAHAGCTAGELKVTAFNGRLFSPSGTDTFARERLRDDVMTSALLAVSTTRPTRGVGRRRINYRDLDVEELGAVYERVLEYEPASGDRPQALDRTRDVRKATGTFYTPRSLTARAVRDTLAPLVAGRTADDILRLRILDPAMGSGAFLVAACVQLAEAAEAALIRGGQWHRSEVTAVDRVNLRRSVAQRCLFGVDLNPTAAQVARLSLWLTTLAADKPLSFLDHHLVVGNSLVGASPADIRRQPGGGRQRGTRTQPTPLFDLEDLTPVLQHAVHTRLEIADEPDESVAIIHGKEKSLASLHAPDDALGRWSRVLDLWCAGWFWNRGVPLDRGTFADLAGLLLQKRSTLPARIAAPLLEKAAGVAREQRFLHWTLIFPEVFSDDRGAPLANPGFDAIVGNPPWDMVRGDSGDPGARRTRRAEALRLTGFVRESGTYRTGRRGHVNRYQLFVERALQLVRRGGRVGLVLPWGAVTDSGSGPLRRHLFNRAQVDTIIGFDNRRGIFPIHRSVRFVLLTCTAGPATDEVRCRFGVNDPEQLDDARASDPDATFTLARSFLARLSGEDDLAIPGVHSQADLRILERLSARFPALGSADGWQAAFGRELNATDDRDLFMPFDHGSRVRYVLEGKHIEPFRVLKERCRHQVRDDSRIKVPRRPRLAYRDVASTTNRLTLIAALVPADAVTTHTLFCLKTPLPLWAQLALCGLLNSFVANYLVRFRVTTHVTVSVVSRLPAPRPDGRIPVFDRVAALAATLGHSPTPAEHLPEYSELQALVARLYDLSEAEFSHILSTFPLITDEIKHRTLSAFREI